MEDVEVLVRRMQAGDMDAFDQIFALYQSRLLRTAWLISGNYADSEDIVQEAFSTVEGLKTGSFPGLKDLCMLWQTHSGNN